MRIAITGKCEHTAYRLPIEALHRPNNALLRVDVDAAKTLDVAADVVYVNVQPPNVRA